MSDMLPLATYSLNVLPYIPTPAIDIEMPVTVRITMAALDPEALDDQKQPSTLRIVKRNPNFDDEEYDDLLNGDYDEDEMASDDEEEEEEEEEVKPAKKSKKSKGKKKDESEDEEEEEESDSDLDEEDDDDEFEEYVLATLSPKTQYQQTLDLTIAPEEEIQFIVTGSYAISLVGNYIKHPFDTPMGDMDDSEDEDGSDYDDELSDSYYNDQYSDDDAEDSDEHDLTPDEDELAPAGSVEEIEASEEEESEEEEKKSKHKKHDHHHHHDHDHDHDHEHKSKNKKRKQEEEEPKKEHKDKKVKFKKDLEEGPTKKEKAESKKADKTPKRRTLEGGVVIEDRTVGDGPAAKKGDRVGMRYIGKLKNGKVFDKNTSGKPFVFKLGRGEVIKGWDVGVAGMSVGSERRIIIPAPYAYGKQALPGIPANSELTFDVKLVSIK